MFVLYICLLDGENSTHYGEYIAVDHKKKTYIVNGSWFNMKMYKQDNWRVKTDYESLRNLQDTLIKLKYKKITA